VGVESIAGVVREAIEDRGVKFIYLGVLGFVCFFFVFVRLSILLRGTAKSCARTILFREGFSGICIFLCPPR
jgi:hypothetical protein